MNTKQIANEDHELAASISETLKEKEIDLIYSIILVKGTDFAINTVAEVQKIISQGGALKQNGEKRSPGGIFFQIAKESCTKSEFSDIFRPQIIERRRRARVKKKIIKQFNSLSL